MTDQPTDVATAKHTVTVPNSINMVSLLGPGDEHLALIEKAFDADVHVRGNRVTLEGPPAELALIERLLDELVTIIRTGQGVTGETVERVLAMLRAETTERPADVLSLNILSNRGRSIRPKTLNQKRYVDSIDKHTITFGIGPAGTGKTYLAMAKAVQALQSKQINRIILSRPAVEAGERLGFLPGTLSEKIDPYLRPLYDALHDMVDPESIPKLLAAGHDRGRAAGVPARPLAQRLVHRARRGAEHHARADEDVPDPARASAPRSWSPATSPRSTCRPAPSPASGWSRTSSTTSTTSPSSGSPPTTWCGTGSWGRSWRRTTSTTPVPSARRSGRPSAVRELQSMSIEVLDESGRSVDVKRLGSLSRFVLDRMRVHPLAELCVKLVDVDTITELNAKWMEGDGPTDVLAFPMDELRPGLVNEEPEEGILGDIMVCPDVAARQAEEAGHPVEAELELLTVHGILHLLGYDHAEPEEHKEMFGLQDELLADWRAEATTDAHDQWRCLAAGDRRRAGRRSGPVLRGGRRAHVVLARPRPGARRRGPSRLDAGCCGCSRTRRPTSTPRCCSGCCARSPRS